MSTQVKSVTMQSARHAAIFGRGRSLRVAITLTCQMAFILFGKSRFSLLRRMGTDKRGGYDQGVFSGIVMNDNWGATFGYPTGSLQGIIVALYNLGAFSGSILNVFTAEKLGRRHSMWFAMAFIIVGATLQTSAYSLPHLLVGRFITGIGTGIETSTVPMYQSELCEARKRGRLVASEPLFVGVGIVTAYFFDFGMSFVGGAISWRLPLACQMIFALLVIVMVFGVPESPRYLHKIGKNEEALSVLCEVYDQSPEGEKVSKEQKEILQALERQKAAGEYAWHQILKNDRVQTGSRVLLAYGSQFMQQMAGINLLVYFAPSSLSGSVGLSKEIAQAVGGTINSMFFFGSLIPTFLLDRMGRRRPMMVGALGCAVSMMLISILTSFRDRGYPEGISKATGSASITFYFTYMAFFGATFNCIPWVYVPEVLPLHARAKGTSIATSANWLWNFVVVMISPSALETLGYKAYLIFMALNLAFIPIIYFFYPETSNMTLEEIDHLFTGDVPVSGKAKGLRKMLPPWKPVLRGKEWMVKGFDLEHTSLSTQGAVKDEKTAKVQEAAE